MTINIRDAVESDIPQIFEVRTSVRANHLSIEQMAEIGVTPQTILEAIHKEPCIWVALEGDQTVGFSMGSSEDACLFAAFVRPEWEGQGIGRLLVERAEAFLFKSNPSIWLHTDGSSRAAGFYEKRGWKRTSLLQDREYRFEKHRR
jgi:ribosomal protein S18 acetylase RimI-like enzyme